jgi:Zn-finger protein
VTVFKYCPECGGTNVQGIGWITGGNGKIKACMDCEKVYEVSDDSKLYREELERLFLAEEGESA